MNTQPASTIETLERRLQAVRTLRDYKIGAACEPRRKTWLTALLRIVEPWMGTGRPVPIGEIVVDARWGAVTHGGPGGWWPTELYAFPGHAKTRALVEIDYWEAVEPLESIPEEEISPLVAACAASLELTHGPMQLVMPDMDNPEDATRVRKILAHMPRHHGWALDAATGRKRKGGGWNPVEDLYRQQAGGVAMEWQWRRYTSELAEAGGLPHPNLLSRLGGWLHPSLRKRPRWVSEH